MLGSNKGQKHGQAEGQKLCSTHWPAETGQRGKPGQPLELLGVTENKRKQVELDKLMVASTRDF